MEQIALKPRIEATYNIDATKKDAVKDVIEVAQDYIDSVNPEAEATLEQTPNGSSVYIKIGRNVLNARTHEGAMHEAENMAKTIVSSISNEKSADTILESGTGHGPVGLLLPRE
jgi:vacuolar-type H+-ATPase subunit E/Vma4